VLLSLAYRLVRYLFGLLAVLARSDLVGAEKPSVPLTCIFGSGAENLAQLVYGIGSAT
jgi:hypothetical protein